MKQTGKRMQKLRWLLLVVLVVQALQLLQGLFTLRSVPVQLLRVEDGWLDLQNQDAAAGLFQLEGSWDFYPEALYTSEDFAAGRTGQPAGEEVSPSDYAYGTHRLRIRATPGAYYALCGFSVDYATRVFVNGSEVAAFGNPAGTLEDFVPRVGYMTLPACAGEDGIIELVVQYGNYVHRDGGHIPVLYLSSPQNIEDFKAGNDLISLTLSGGLLLLALYFLMNAAMRRRAAYLCLTLCCVLMALRDQNFYIVHLLPEDTSWYFAYRLFICMVMLMPVSILLLLKCMYAKATAHWPLTVYLAAAGAAAVLIGTLPTRQLVSVSTAVYYLSIPYLVYLVFGTVRGFVRRGGLETADALVLSGFAVRVSSACSEKAHGSFEMLLQVFLNLVINANRHTKNGTITLSAGAGEDGFILFQVADTGSGIVPADLPRIFEQGYSGSGSTGLGLTICREAVEAHGGRIWVERTGPKGTTIAFTVKKEEEQ